MKVKIEIKKGNYSLSHKEGAEYTSVGYSGRMYGGCSPCDTEEEINQAIESAKENIIAEGDTPFLDDGKEKDLTSFFEVKI
jgi:hypothetical protein